MQEFFNINNNFLWCGIIWFILFAVFSVFGNLWGNFTKEKMDWKLHQIWLNGLGAFVGWMMVYFLWNTPFSEWEVQHIIAFAIGFLGITGYLPRVASNQ